MQTREILGGQSLISHVARTWNLGSGLSVFPTGSCPSEDTGCLHVCPPAWRVLARDATLVKVQLPSGPVHCVP